VLAVGWGLVGPGTAWAELSASFTFSPLEPLTGQLVTFSSTSTGVIEPQRWDLDGDGVCDDASGPNAQRSFQTAGTYAVSLCVTDGIDEASVKRKITVLNRPPVAAFTYAPVSPLTDDTVVLTSASLDPDGPIASLAWDLDNDGAFDDGSGVTTSLSFPRAGAYTVRLLAIDRDGAASVALQAITIGMRPPELLGPFPLVRVTASVTKKGAKIRELVVDAPTGSDVKVRCRGRGCPSRELTLRAASERRSIQVRISRLVRIRRFRHHTLRPGAVVQIWVTKPGRIGKYTRFRIRRGKPPARVDRCVMPGARLPAPCPSS
jgi:PKD domain